MEARDRLVFALDVSGGVEALRFVELLRGVVGTFKIGLELFCAEGPSLVRAVAERGGAVFLDLKLHDIPATVGRAAERAVAGGGVRWLTVHAAGGAGMMREAVRACGDRAGVLGVTVLTSVDDDVAVRVGIERPVADLAVRLAAEAAEAGCAGVVASPGEAAAIRRRIGAVPVVVTPGIRPAGEGRPDRDDQRRVATPEAAIAAGADVIVVGRPIRDAPDPVGAALAILRSIAGATAREAP